MSIYLNWAATSSQKPAAMVSSVTDYLTQNQHQNQNRSLAGLEAVSTALKTRLTLAQFFNVSDPSQVIFTANATMSLNMILNGLLQPGDHVLTTSMEHNAVTRPLTLLQEQGVSVTYLPCDSSGRLDPNQIEMAIQPNTKLLVMTHASNVTGTIQPVTACFKLAKAHGLFTVLDASQTAGYLPIDLLKMHIDVLAFTGHKSLLGLEGTGGFCLADGVADQMDPWLVGGTGNASDLTHMPDFLPDKFEPGTPNTLGILSLGASVATIQKWGLDELHEKEQALTAYFLKGLSRLPVTIYGPGVAEEMVPVVSITAQGFDPGELGGALYDEAGIITRCGLHCAPMAHKTIGTYPEGTVRFSFGFTTTQDELDTTLAALAAILKGGS